MIQVTLKGGVVREYESGTTVGQVAASLGAGLAKAACAGRVDGEVRDLRFPLEADCALEILTFEDQDGKRAFWHTTSHVLAQAVQHLFPEAKFAIGPAIDNGFYYDFDVPTPFSAEDLEKIEAEMAKIVKAALPLESFTLEPAQALELMKDQPYKVELIEEHSGKGERISFYRQGDFTDLGAGPHLMTTAGIKAIRLTSCTGAYWRGDSDNKMLQRIYGTAFTKKEDLDNYLHMLEEAKKRDHRKLGKELGLFTIMDEGPGFPFFLPNGMVLRNTLIDYWREVHKRYGYVEISTPMMLNRSLWERSGHWDHYKENMYTTVIDDTDFAIKPMNCPGGMLVYKLQPHSYRDLPLRMGELGLVHRHELSGALHGLFRVRCFTQDDAHIFMTWDQMKDEIKGVVRLFDEVYSVFGLTYQIEVSTMPEDHMGDEKDWDFATETLKAAVTEMGKDFVINEGDGAFYGPKLDFMVKDAIGRKWQLGTIQVDYNLPERFDLEYTGADNLKHRPVMIHRAPFGSMERFVAVLIEHTGGKFPLWLAPDQVVVMPISEKFNDYAQKLSDLLNNSDIRTVLDDRNEKIGRKIRDNELKKIPYLLIVGENEMNNNTVSVRRQGQGDMGTMSVEDFISKINEEVNSQLQTIYSY